MFRCQRPGSFFFLFIILPEREDMAVRAARPTPGHGHSQLSGEPLCLSHGCFPTPLSPSFFLASTSGAGNANCFLSLSLGRETQVTQLWSLRCKKSAGGGAGVSGQGLGCDPAGHSLCARAHTRHMAREPRNVSADILFIRKANHYLFFIKQIV